MAQSITGSDALVSFEALGKTIADKEAELKTVRGELQKARRIVKKLDEIEAIETGTAPAPAPKKQAVKKPAAKKPAKAKTEQAPKDARHPGGLTGGDVHDLSEDSVLRPARHRAEIDNYRAMQEKALAGAGAHPEAKSLADGLQSMIDALEVDMATIDELQEIHDRK